MRPGSSVHWSAYPALLLAGGFALGIVGDFLLSPGISLWIGGVGGGLAVFGGAQWWARTRLVTLAPLGRVAAVVLIAISAGGVRHAVYRAPSPRALTAVAETGNESTVLRGLVEDAPERSESTRFTLDANAVYGPGDTLSVEGKVRVTLRPSPWADSVGPFPRIQQGNLVRVRGALRRPPGLRNPGGFDYRAYLARRGVCCTMYVGGPDHVSVQGDHRGMVGASLASTRRYVRSQVDRYVASAGGKAVLRALLLGDRSQITETQRARFSQTGLMHLLAVSGLHVFLIGMVLYALLRPLLTRFRLPWRVVEGSRAALTIVVLIFYMLLTGARPSVVRAVVMATLFIGGIVFQRSAHSLNTLGVAAFVLLAVRPAALFDVGFQLSMSAVAGIVTLNPRFSEALPEWNWDSEMLDWVVSTGTVSAAAILGTAPVLLYHFGWVSVAGLLLNMVGIPCTGLALAAAIAMTAAGGVWTLAGAAFGSAADLFVQGLLSTSRYGAAWFSWAGIRMAVPDPWVLGALVAGLVAIAQWPRPRNRWRFVIVGLLLGAVSVWGEVLGRDAEPTLDVLFFDVGQGDAALITTPGGHRTLVDAGPWSPEGGAGKFVLAPYLERRGIQWLNTVVVTHPDEDHLGGLPYLLKEMSVGRVVHSGQAADTDLYRRTQRLLDREGVTERAVQRGDTLAVGSGARARVLGPPSHWVERETRSKNEASVVLRVSYGDVDVLLPGDVEAAAERNLVRTYGEQIASRVVKVPHHGSSTSSTQQFVRAAVNESKEGRAVVSVGRDNRYEMPDEDVLSRWRTQGMKINSTAQHGAVWLRTDGKDLWRVHWK